MCNQKHKTIQVIQPTILTHKDGKLQALCRTQNNGSVATTWSEDNGESWSPVTFIDLPNNNSGIDGITLKDGRHLLEDSPINQYSYPSVIQDKDGKVHIVYTWRRQRIKYACLDPQQVEVTSFEEAGWKE